MPRQNHSTYEEWLYLEADGGLSTAERAQLHRHLLSCSRCRRESEQVPALFEFLSSGQVEVREGFSDEVMAALPAAGWEARNPRSWVVAAVLLIALGGLSALLVGAGGEMQGTGVVGAIAELFLTTVTAGAGLLSASWQGIGMAVSEAIGGSALQTLVFTIFVVGVDVLFLRSLIRSWRRPAVSARSETNGQ
jgi:anti-sigma factor RsiW